MLCLSHLTPQATSDGVHMNAVETHCQSVRDAQEPRYTQTRTAIEHMAPALHFLLILLRLGVWEEEHRAI